jgi:tetratricopeptide (TPR) repeat protein
MKTFPLLLICFVSMLIVERGQSQSFTLFYQQGDSLMQVEDYQGALNAYTNAFDIYEPNHPLSYINPAIAAVKIHKVDLAINYLEQAAHFGLDDAKYLAYFSKYNDLQAHPKWPGIEESVNSRIDGINNRLKAELEAMYALDQVVRNVSGCIDTTNSISKAEYRAFQLIVQEKDSLNLIRLEAIIKAHGWPGISKVGIKANQAAWIIIQHAKLEKQQQYLPTLSASVENGESQPKHLALLSDRVLVRQGKMQLYGTQIDNRVNPPKPYPIEDIENVDQRRKKVGLEPLKDYLIKLGVSLETLNEE